MPAVVGVPVMAPAGLSDKPPGKTADPVARDHVYGGVPPAPAREALYATFTLPLGRGDAVVIVRDTGTVNGPETDVLLLSVTVTVKPAVVALDGGFPLRTPAVLMLSHEGNPVAVHE